MGVLTGAKKRSEVEPRNTKEKYIRTAPLQKIYIEILLYTKFGRSGFTFCDFNMFESVLKCQGVLGYTLRGERKCN